MKQKLMNGIEYILIIIIAMVFVCTLKYFGFTLTLVQGRSMESTLFWGNRLIVSRISRTKKELPKKGQIVTFEEPSKTKYLPSEINIENPVAIYEEQEMSLIDKFLYYVIEWKKRSYIKRVIALPGDFVHIEDGKVYVNGEELIEDYIDEGKETYTPSFNDFTVPENCIFAMGDNRPNSLDCRSFGCIPLEKIEGVALFRFFPVNVFGKLH